MAIATFLSNLKRLLLLGEDIQRLAEGVQRLANKVDNHEGRLIRIETIIDLAQRGQLPKLPGS